MAKVSTEPRVLECQNHTLKEVIDILKRSSSGLGNESKLQVISLTPASARYLAQWLEELDNSRAAVFEIRMALTKVPVR